MSIDTFIYLDDYGNECCEVESLREYLKDKAIVPVEPSEEMLCAGVKAWHTSNIAQKPQLTVKAIYKAMLPSSPVKADAQVNIGVVENALAALKLAGDAFSDNDWNAPNVRAALYEAMLACDKAILAAAEGEE